MEDFNDQRIQTILRGLRILYALESQEEIGGWGIWRECFVKNCPNKCFCEK